MKYIKDTKTSPLFLGTLSFLFLAHAMPARASVDCSQRMAKVAEEETGTLNNWASIYKSFGRHAECDDGSLAEGYTEAVVHLMASNWESLPRAAEFASKRPAFRQFLIRHIDASANTDELRKIETLSATQCDAKLVQLCASIRASAKRAIGESGVAKGK